MSWGPHDSDVCSVFRGGGTHPYSIVPHYYDIWNLPPQTPALNANPWQVIINIQLVNAVYHILIDNAGLSQYEKMSGI